MLLSCKLALSVSTPIQNSEKPELEWTIQSSIGPSYAPQSVAWHGHLGFVEAPKTSNQATHIEGLAMFCSCPSVHPE